MGKQRNNSSDERKLSAGEQKLKATIQQLRASEQQLKAANQQLDASNQQLRASEEELRKLSHNMGERVKELECLYGLSYLAEQRDMTLEEIFQGLVELIPPGWQYSEITAARIVFENRRFKTGNFRKTVWIQSADIKVHGRKAGTIEVCYLKKRPVIDEGPFLKEERKLLNVLAKRLGHIVEHKRAEEQLKAANQQLQASEQQLRAANQQLRANEQQLRAANQQLRANEQQLRAANQQLRANEQQLRAANQQLQASEQQLLDDQGQLKQLASQLTLAEESERHRIATELHATIGQSLAVSKLQLDTLRASAPSAYIARTLGEVCESLDETIEGTRSLTFDLSYPILYELGFEAAVSTWLADRVEGRYGIKTEFEEDRQPKPLDEDVSVFLFRDVRELLINVVKHAQAKKVKVSIRRVGRQIEICVEDDGTGFDPEKVAATAVRKGEFGLFSIRERLEQLGGEVEIESAPGHGTKVTVTAPLRRE